MAAGLQGEKSTPVCPKPMGIRYILHSHSREVLGMDLEAKTMKPLRFKGQPNRRMRKMGKMWLRNLAATLLPGQTLNYEPFFTITRIS